jgi:hypothetical protein
MSIMLKRIGQLLLLATALFYCAKGQATAGTADDLYSETIYIQRSAAEVPGSLESNASSVAAADLEVENEELDTKAVLENGRRRRETKKSASN